MPGYPAASMRSPPSRAKHYCCDLRPELQMSAERGVLPGCTLQAEQAPESIIDPMHCQRLYALALNNGFGHGNAGNETCITYIRG